MCERITTQSIYWSLPVERVEQQTTDATGTAICQLNIGSRVKKREN